MAAAAEPTHETDATRTEPLTEAEVWELVLSNEGLLRREVRAHMARHRRRAEFEDMYADVVLLRAHRIMRLFDWSRGVKPITYLVKNCKWYAMEWCLGRKYKKRVPTESIDTRYGEGRGEHPPCPGDRSGLSPEVASLLGRLPPDLAEVLVWCHAKGYTHLEVARYLGVSQAEVREMLTAGVFLARMLEGEEDEP